MSKGKLLLLLGALCSVTVQAMKLGDKSKRPPLAAVAMNAAKDRALAVLNDDAIAYNDKQLAVQQAVADIAGAGKSAIATDVENRGIAQSALDGYVADYIYGLNFAKIPATDKGAIEAIATQIVNAGLQAKVLKHISNGTFGGSKGTPPPPPPGSGGKGGTPPPPVTIQSLFDSMLALTDVNYRTDGDTQDWIQECDTSLAVLSSSGNAEQEAMITAVYNFYDQAKLLSVGAKLPIGSLDACVALKDASAMFGSDKKQYTTWFDNTFQPWARSLVHAPPPPPVKKSAPSAPKPSTSGVVDDGSKLVPTDSFEVAKLKIKRLVVLNEPRGIAFSQINPYNAKNNKGNVLSPGLGELVNLLKNSKSPTITQDMVDAVNSL